MSDIAADILAELRALRTEVAGLRCIVQIQTATTSTSSMLTPGQVAELYSVTTRWVYDHASELGAVRLGDGPRARLRLDPAKVHDRLTRGKPADVAPSKQATRRHHTTTGQTRSGVPLLDIRAT